MNKPLLLLITISLTFFLSESCTHEPVEPKITDTTTTPEITPEWATPPSNSCDPNTVYFSNYVQKLIITKCATLGYSETCHDAGRVNNEFLRLVSYNDIVNALKDKPNPFDSDFWEQIDRDNMPKIGGPLTPDEKTNLEKWINQGMKNNACNDCEDYISFSESVAPLLYLNCSGCHNQLSKSGTIALFKFTPYSGDDILYDEVKKLTESGQLTSAISRNSSPMPKLAEKLYECEYNAIIAWKEAGYPNN